MRVQTEHKKMLKAAKETIDGRWQNALFAVMRLGAQKRCARIKAEAEAAERAAKELADKAATPAVDS